jgi:hypothetical protein
VLILFFVADLGVSFPSPLPPIFYRRRFLLFFRRIFTPFSTRSSLGWPAETVCRAPRLRSGHRVSFAVRIVRHASLNGTRGSSSSGALHYVTWAAAPPCVACVRCCPDSFPPPTPRELLEKNKKKSKKSKRKQKKNRERGTIGSATPSTHRFGLAACLLPHFPLFLSFFLFLSSPHL